MALEAELSDYVFTEESLQHNHLTAGHLLGGRLPYFQAKDGFRSGLEPILLAAACRGWRRPPQRIIELGCGAGAISLLLADNYPSAHIRAVEIEAGAIAVCLYNLQANHLADRVELCQQSIFSLSKDYRRQFDLVVSNPPYYRRDRAASPPDERRALAMMEGEEQGLSVWLEVMKSLVAVKGWLALIVKADRLDTILYGLSLPSAASGKIGFGNLALLPLWTRAKSAARLVIILAQQGSAAPLRLLPGLAIHQTYAEKPSYEALMQDLLWRSGMFPAEALGISPKQPKQAPWL